jgi:hypothetical protein
LIESLQTCDAGHHVTTVFSPKQNS